VFSELGLIEIISSAVGGRCISARYALFSELSVHLKCAHRPRLGSSQRYPRPFSCENWEGKEQNGGKGEGKEGRVVETENKGRYAYRGRRNGNRKEEGRGRGDYRSGGGGYSAA